VSGDPDWAGSVPSRGSVEALEKTLVGNNKTTDARGGSALIFVLWVIGLLAMLVSSLAFEARIEARMTSYYRNRTKADYLARSGLEIAELVMDKAQGLAGEDVDEEKAATDEWYMYAKHLADGGQVLIEHDLKEAGTGEGRILVKIKPEPAKINVNMLIGRTKDHDDYWEGILDSAGVPEEMWGELIDSFYDWTDKDDSPEGEGAETDDYYANLDPPYEARNGPLDTVGELRLIKGFSKTIVYGGDLNADSKFEDEKIHCSGIADMLTTYGDGKINVNAAGSKVLMTLPGMDENIVRLIEEERAGWTDDDGTEHDESFKDVADFMSRIDGVDPAVKNMITTQSKIYRITSTGEINGITRSLWCIVRFSGKGLTVLRWREDD